VLFSEKFACPVSGFTIPEIEPRLFSFNNPFGACPTCDGLGPAEDRPDLIVPDERTLRDGAIAPWAKSSSPYYNQTLEALGKHFGFKLGSRWSDLPEEGQDVILFGTAPTEDRISLSTTTARAPMRRTSPSKASSPISSAAGRRRIRLGARGDRALHVGAPCPACNGFA
jgi:excinuclease ABC subunit A